MRRSPHSSETTQDWVVLDLVGSGMTMDEIVADHPELEREDIVACLHYARFLLSGEPVRHVA